MTFDPKESVDMQGNTGPYIQNAYVRIQSVLRKSGASGECGYNDYLPVEIEKMLIRTLTGIS
jgi:arginyl-tRNA synthetase